MQQKTFIAIAGNPNSGKTTAFNKYTGARQHVGNYPGITVEKKTGVVHCEGEEIYLIDLPGTYSLTAYTQEEVVAREVLAEEKPQVVIDVLNASVLERNLYLTVQLLEMGVPVVLALNMMDEARSQGIVINTKRMQELMGLPVLPTVARTGEGMDEVLAMAVSIAKQTPEKMKQPLIISYGPDIDNALLELIPLVEKHAILTDKYAARWVALKVLEHDEDILKQLGAKYPETAHLLTDLADTCGKHLEATLGTYPEAIIADYRYGYITSLLRQGVLSDVDAQKNRIAYSDKMDALLTNRVLGPVILGFVLYMMYFITFTIGQYPADRLKDAFGWLHDAVGSVMADGLLKSMVVSGIIDGVGGVIEFVPLIMVMFFLISILEDSGYMARVAYMLDRLFRLFGLHGSSVMPFIVSGGIAGGCAVPGIMAARTLRSPRERLATILTAPFMACGAKLPVFLLFASIFFPNNKTMTMFLLTLCGWAAALLTARFLRSTIIKGDPTPFVMELPPYRLPTWSGTLIHTWERAWQYIKKAGTIILAISIILWAGMTFPLLPQERLDAFEAEKTAATAKLDVEQLTADPSEDLLERMKENPQIEKLLAGGSSLEDIYKKALQEYQAGLASGSSVPEMNTLVNEKYGIVSDTLHEALITIENQESMAALRNSIAGRVGTSFENISTPLGFDWKTNIALLGGFAAKEVIISTLGTAYSLGDIDPEEDTNLATRIAEDPQWTKANAVALLLFTLLYSPCMVSVSVIKSETGQWRWAFLSIFFNLGLAYTVALLANQLIKAF